MAGIFNRPGDGRWPLTAGDADDLEAQLIARRHLLPLPKEPAALANVLEVGLVDFLIDRAAAVDGLRWQRGTERGRYPDIEMLGPALGGAYWAVDVKVARRATVKRGSPRGRTAASRCTRATPTSSILTSRGQGRSGHSATTPGTSTSSCCIPWIPTVVAGPPTSS